jgi:hypothetical protein
MLGVPGKEINGLCNPGNFRDKLSEVKAEAL